MYIIIEWISRIVLAFFKVIETAGGAPPPGRNFANRDGVSDTCGFLSFYAPSRATRSNINCFMTFPFKLKVY